MIGTAFNAVIASFDLRNITTFYPAKLVYQVTLGIKRGERFQDTTV